MKTSRCLLVLLLLSVMACPGEGPPTQQYDSYYPMPDGPQQQQPDLYPQQYPDLYPPYPDGPAQQPDFWTQPPDIGYSGSPFGCQQDSDCFGLRCCTTPWGVKLCAEVCDGQ